MRVLVRGATTMLIPIPNRMHPGQDVDEGVDRRDQAARPGLARGRDPGQPEQPGGVDQGPDRQERAAADPAGQAADPGRQEGQEQARRQPDGPGCERRVAEGALQEQALESERDVERAVDQQGRQVDRGELAVAEHAEGHERVGPASHQEREGDQGDKPDAQGDEGDRIGPLLGLAADRPEGEPADGQGDDDGAEPVEAARSPFSSRLSCDVGDRRVQGDDHERDVDQEGDPPADRLDQQPAQGRPEDRRGRGGRRPDPERPAAGGPVERRP